MGTLDLGDGLFGLDLTDDLAGFDRVTLGNADLRDIGLINAFCELGQLEFDRHRMAVASVR
jgi:hypothetical protein